MIEQFGRIFGFLFLFVCFLPGGWFREFREFRVIEKSGLGM